MSDRVSITMADDGVFIINTSRRVERKKQDKDMPYPMYDYEERTVTAKDANEVAKIVADFFGKDEFGKAFEEAVDMDEQEEEGNKEKGKNK